MLNEKYYKKMFFIGALWNWIAATIFAIGWKIVFPFFGMEFPNYLMFYIMFLELVFFFGVGYYWVSRDITTNHDIIRLGAFAKVCVFVSFVFAWFGGEIPLILVIPGVVDLIFAVLFFEFLIKYRKMQTAVGKA